MRTLSADLRNQLGRVIQTARREGEAGARKALEALAVHARESHASMTPDERVLRNRLRAHGRQLGDALDRARGTQEIGRLAHEVAYEHWHRMLFARFLAENQLLIEPDTGVPISMTECEDLARETGEDPWAMTARFAHRMLPRIFRPDDPALEVVLAPETRQALERLLESLPADVFTAGDALGWTYQFWQAEKKQAVNESGVKIGADELPAVTQLFTERYMVLFLFHNTIGAWRAGKLLAERPELAATARSEDELRRAVRLRAQGGYDFSYLRFVREPREGGDEDAATGPWRPAAGGFDSWPKTAAELRVLDPCCGSGHFLVEGFELLVRLRMDEESLPLEVAIRAVLADNLFGLEIDPRCTQIAAFNVALSAWKLAGRPIDLPPLHIACSGLAPHATRDEWLALAEEAAAAGGMGVRRDLFETEETLLSVDLRGALSALHELFQKAPELGSLLDPRAMTGELFRADFTAVEPLLAAVLQRERTGDELAERAVAAQGMARAAELLAGRYTLVITNVPYLGRGGQSDVLRAFADDHYREARADLATVFLLRTLRCLGQDGTVAVVTPQNWLFLTRYEKLRKNQLKQRTCNLVARLGPGAFETIGGHVVKVALNVVTARKPEKGAQMAGLDASLGQSPPQKAALLRGGASRSMGEKVSERAAPKAVGASEGGMLLDEETSRDADVAPPVDGSVRLLPQNEQLRNPDARVVFAHVPKGHLLSAVADSYQGIGTSDNPQFLYRFWEVGALTDAWRYVQVAPNASIPVSGCTSILFWENGAGRYCAHAMSLKAEGRLGGWKSGGEAWDRAGLAVSVTGRPFAATYFGTMFDTTVAAVVPKAPHHLPAITACITDPHFERRARQLDQALSLTEHSLLKVPFDLMHWERVAAEQYPNGLPQPQSDDPTQWLFHGHPAHAEPPAALQVAVARLLGYRWPPEHDPDMRLAAEARAWVERCGELDAFADRDGIVCLNALRGEPAAADRLRRLLAAAFGSDWTPAKERELLAAAAAGGSPAASLEEWLRDRFFEEHCKLFHHRPFVWHVWDGRKDGFHALVNYHRLAGPDGEGRRTLEALTYGHLGEWIERQRAEQREGREGADARLAAAQDLQTQLERILAGEPPCDIFVRWKPLARQPVGWEPDINDGVRLNIRPFLSVELRAGGRKGAGILRWKPNIHWRKDRGKEPESLRPREEFPWFWGCAGDGTREERTDFLGGAEFDGNRWNDLHYGDAVKGKAREWAVEEPTAEHAVS